MRKDRLNAETAHILQPKDPRELILSRWWGLRVPTPKQWIALQAYRDVPELLYGGAAGGGKSEYLLFWATMHADNPKSHIMLFRRTYADLALPGALLDRARDYWIPSGVAYDGGRHRFTFPSGATVTFGYMHTKDDRYRYQGAELTGVGFDEAGQLRPEDLSYMASRVRKHPDTDLPMVIRYTSNPGGPAHDYLRDKFVRSSDPNCIYLPAFLADNVHLEQAAYRKMLALLDPIERARLKKGIGNR